MARKRPIEDPPPASSSDEEVEEEEEEEDEEASEDLNSSGEENDGDGKETGEEDEDDEQQEEKKTDLRNKKFDSDDSRSDSDSDSDKSPPSRNPADLTVKARGESSSKTKKKPSASLSNGADERSQGFRRVWSEDNELRLLKGMIEYELEGGTDPSADMAGFYDFIKDSLSFDVSKNQLIDKVKRLRRKYQNNVKRGDGGEDPVLLKPHEYMCFQLSKKIWDMESNNDTKKKKKAKTKSHENQEHSKANGGIPATKDKKVDNNGGVPAKKDKKVDKEKEDSQVDNDGIWKDHSCLKNSLEIGQSWALPDLCKNVLKQNIRDIDQGKVRDMENKLKKLQQEELELHLKKAEFAFEQAKLALDIFNSKL